MANDLHLPGFLVADAWSRWHDARQDTLEIAHATGTKEYQVYNTISRLRAHWFGGAVEAAVSAIAGRVADHSLAPTARRGPQLSLVTTDKK